MTSIARQVKCMHLSCHLVVCIIVQYTNKLKLFIFPNLLADIIIREQMPCYIRRKLNKGND